MLGYYGEKQPMNLIPGYGDTNASIHGAFAILAALCTVKKPGKASIFPWQKLTQLRTAGGSGDGLQHERTGTGMQGNRHPVLMPHGNYPARGEISG